jgi:hypothetical protein
LLALFQDRLELLFGECYLAHYFEASFACCAEGNGCKVF